MYRGNVVEKSLQRLMLACLRWHKDSARRVDYARWYGLRVVSSWDHWGSSLIIMLEVFGEIPVDASFV